MKKKIIAVFGTRPEAIKMAPVVNELKKRKNLSLKIVVTAQHRKMLDQVLELFKIKPDYDLNIMIESQTLHSITSKCIEGLKKILLKEKPDLVLVHGDTTTTMASSLASFYCKIPVGHVEAGLRSFDPYNPFPEELNRKLTDSVSLYHFAPTEGNCTNLINEGFSRKSIYITGNTVIDTLLETAKKDIQPSLKALRKLDLLKKIILITAHRRENLGKPLKDICMGLKKLSKTYKDVLFVYPVHLNPKVKKTVKAILSEQKNIILIPPVSYSDMVWLMGKCYFCFTDSGGIQEEAPSLGKPVLVLRKVTERPEAVKAGTVKVIGTETKDIYAWGSKLLEDKRLYKKFSKSVNPYGDGKASKRIADIIEYIYGFKTAGFREWKI
ncbi:non-hydrolyzing UDP-N-acetylglucosamine 2-epimerase [Elusimicrobiota bacterium]